MDFVFTPAVLLATLLATGYASLFHLWTGRSIRDLSLFLVCGGGGFALGQWAGQILQWDVLQVGQLCVLEASVASTLALIVVKSLLP